MDNAQQITITNGKVNALGIDVSISDIIGEKIVDQYLAQLTEDDMKAIFKAIDNELFDRFNDNTRELRKTTTTSNGCWSSTKEDTLIWRIAKNNISKIFADKITERVEEIINTEEFKQKAEDIANEIVDYATDGYKNDLKSRVKERLVYDTVDPYPMYNNTDLRSIIREEISKSVSNNPNGYY